MVMGDRDRAMQGFQINVVDDRNHPGKELVTLSLSASWMQV
jgi:hypothetical protein